MFRNLRGDVLALGRRWPAVLLPSHLINHPEGSVRRRFVEAAKRHIEQTGVFYVKRHSTAWLSTVQEGRIGESNGVGYYAENVSRKGDLLTMTLRYEAFGQSWTQSFTTCALEKHQVENLLSSCGFSSFRWLGKQELWVAAAPSDANPFEGTSSSLKGLPLLGKLYLYSSSDYRGADLRLME